MARRNNRARTSAPPAIEPEMVQAPQTPMSFASPTEFVALPSRGKVYPADHPFHMLEEVEIKFMTARHEDILSSQVLVSKGLALDRLLKELMVDNVDTKSLVSGDRNALLVAARITAYGAEYLTEVKCPSCGSVSDYEFDLSGCSLSEIPDDLQFSSDGTYFIKLPVSGTEVELRHLSVKEQEFLTKNAQSKIKNNISESSTTDYLKMVVVSFNGETGKSLINKFVDTLPARDSLAIRRASSRVDPDIDMVQDFNCPSCGASTALEVPLGRNFFWPK